MSLAKKIISDEARARVERFRKGTAPSGVRDRLAQALLERRSHMMVARTVAIDDAVRDAGCAQIVILGAGLDGRAWRMSELRDKTVFEVDHPDSQREKRTRAEALPQIAGDVRFVPVDFQRDDLDSALSAAGHDPSRPTTWIWEGVVMYLALADIEATLAVIARRSAEASRLIVAYHSPGLILPLIRVLVGRLGEPLRTTLTADGMRAMLEKHGFAVLDDKDLPTIGAALSADIAKATRVMTHARIVIACRQASARA
jgi:methyltransferase (TIGR00027 family)